MDFVDHDLVLKMMGYLECQKALNPKPPIIGSDFSFILIFQNYKMVGFLFKEKLMQKAVKELVDYMKEPIKNQWLYGQVFDTFFL